ncbi:hypothetical protein [Mycolicibacterium komossense]|uniref:Secreted protein n=1 Tax=Mycolicibacterium komossense TaxID=1779 RepID=A0ABT3CHQ4_9MYCO|nr:hypothetical protein [Mycolicibacterium komossense]MCV7229018.1 hypothetical protein [Mycolicibacterium komossense]
MGAFAAQAGATIAAAALCAAVGVPAAATASEGDWGINGTYIATSNGDWSKTNEQFRNEVSVRSTWTISTTCANPTDCVGTVKSDQGWTAPIYAKAGLWYVKRSIPGWEPCPDGTTADGLQMYRFFAGDPETGQAVPSGSSTFLGEDVTKSASGSCGINKQLVISMPFKMVAA